MKKIIFVMICFIELNVLALNCSNEEIDRLKNLADQIEFKYDYQIKEEKNNDDNYKYAEYTITAKNLSDSLKVFTSYDFEKGVNFEFNNASSVDTLGGFSEGDNIKIYTEAYEDNGCLGNLVLTKTISLPYYNKYYDEQLCQHNQDFKYCAIMIDNKIDDDIYNSELVKYQEIKENNGQKNSEILLYIIAGFIILLGVICTFIAKYEGRGKKKKNKRVQ